MSSTEVRGAREIPLFIKDEIVAHAIVDDRDFEWLNQRTWGANISGLTKEGRPAYYALRQTRVKGKPVREWMHREIFERRSGLFLPDGALVDHADRNRLNNQYSNLRQATTSQNSHNAVYSHTKIGRYRGADWQSRRGVWRARISVSGKRLFIGSFADEEEAARRYDEAAKQFFGEFAILNFGGSK